MIGDVHIARRSFRLVACPNLPAVQVALPVRVPLRLTGNIGSCRSCSFVEMNRREQVGGGIVDLHNQSGRSRAVASGIAGPGRQGMCTVGSGSRIPAERMGRCKIFRAEGRHRRAELNTRHTYIIPAVTSIVTLFTIEPPKVVVMDTVGGSGHC